MTSQCDVKPVCLAAQTHMIYRSTVVYMSMFVYVCMCVSVC